MFAQVTENWINSGFIHYLFIYSLVEESLGKADLIEILEKSGYENPRQDFSNKICLLMNKCVIFCLLLFSYNTVASTVVTYLLKYCLISIDHLM